MQSVRPFLKRKYDESTIKIHVQRKLYLIFIYNTIKIMHKIIVLARLPQLSCVVAAKDIK